MPQKKKINKCFAVDPESKLANIVCMYKLRKECQVSECKGKRYFQ